MTITASATFEAVCDGFPSGLAGTIAVRVIDNAGGTTTNRTTSDISEYPSGSGVYYKSMTAPSTPGQYTILWDNGSTTPGNIALEDLFVV